MKTVKFTDLCKFQPKQLEAVKAAMNHTFTLYGGAAGGGKSYFLRWMALGLLMYYAARYRIKGIRVGIFCETFNALKDRQLVKIPFEFPSQLGTLNQSDYEFRLNPKYGGGVLAFRNLDDPSKYLSSEFAAVLIDELSRNPRETFDFLNSRRRWPGVPDTKFIGATNPGGIGHAWVKKLWVDRDFSREGYKPEEFAFIPAKAQDNKYLGTEYEAQLSMLPEKLRRAYKDGDWDIFAGQFFTEWNRDRHVIRPIEIPTGWTRIRCLDYGYQNPSACYWLAINYDGEVYVYRELYQPGLTYAQLADRIRIMTGEETIEYTVADTSMFAKTLDTGEYGQDIMAEHGVEITQATKDRVAGLNLMREHMRGDRIKFFDVCTNAIRTIPALVHDEAKVEDIAKGSEDHACDAIRYGLMSLPPKPEKGKPGIKNPYENDKDSPWGREVKLTDLYTYG